MSQRNPADDALKAAWLATNAATSCPDLPAMGYNSLGFSDQAIALLGPVGIATRCNYGPATDRLEKAYVASLAFEKQRRMPRRSPKRFT